MLITAGRVLSPTCDGYLKDGAVLIEDHRVTAVGPRSELAEPADAAQAADRDGPGAERLDFPDATLLPGLIDAHVHLIFDAGPEPLAGLQQSNEELLAAMRLRARQLLDGGVTTARDLGDRDGLALRLAAEIAGGSADGVGGPGGPHLLCAGTPLTPPGGHCHFLGGEVADATAIRALVRANIEAGATVVKVMESGGGLTKDGPRIWERQFPPEALAVAVDEAHRAGVPVAAHAHGTEAIAAAVQADVDTIEHCTWIVPGGGVEMRDDVLEQIVAKGIRVCPTISPNWHRLPQIFPDRAEAIFDVCRRMVESGARLIAGTDAGVQRARFGGLADSLGLYEHLGVPNRDILRMATTEAADALGLGDLVGAIAPGFRADLLVVDGDPLTDLGALRRISAVIAAGQLYRPEAAPSR
ncbi:amidohydrolase family protein [Phaeacidiphilus oryzae]|uniref:amidohydrolase family protein n=1 Tax=Phaeacidiphilus oryzae TaxID=348818 RepID=UPI000561470D|nr:amidohydrolase family protein [Phaeacidiphilus oryzae]